MYDFDLVLEDIRKNTDNHRARGTAFEKVVAKWLLKDPVQSKRFKAVDSWRDWARANKKDGRDKGSDLVATCHGGTFVAIQVKCYAEDKVVGKSDLDKFLADTGKDYFSGRLFVDTTKKDWGKNAIETLKNQNLPFQRIGLKQLRESGVKWSSFLATGVIGKPEPKELREHQIEAVAKVVEGLSDAERGKLIMACGTGKTLVGLRIAEEITKKRGHVLVLVPSLALMSQTIRGWCEDTSANIAAFAVCSDVQVGRRRRAADDAAEIEVSDLEIPATTDAKKFSDEIAIVDKAKMCVVFSTYQSISVIADAQKIHDAPTFKLIICDEAHRTTGVTLAKTDHSDFVKVHDNCVIAGEKRLYMTATPRVFSDSVSSKARDENAFLASMDDTKIFGEVLHHYSFSRAVEGGILTDYRVIVLAMAEAKISGAVQRRLKDSDGELRLDDVTKIIGCWKALAKDGIAFDKAEGKETKEPMRRALAFCRSISSSKLITEKFPTVVEEYENSQEGGLISLECEMQHVDGTHQARERNEKLEWLKAGATEGNSCRILSNARCLTEGVDIPSLDAILFLHPRESQIEVIQSVGRVMRQSCGKRMGYVILPFGIPAGVEPDVALRENKRFKVIWQILNALRAHDERLEAKINQYSLGQDIGGIITVVTDTSPRDIDEGSVFDGGAKDETDNRSNKQIPDQLPLDEFSRAIMAKIVEKCGTRFYWEDWAGDVAVIAEKHISRITGLIEQEGSAAQLCFNKFLKELQSDLNESITQGEAVEMLAQHLITRPVFWALFERDAGFIEQNPVSRSMQTILELIDETMIGREAKTLEQFYESV